MRQFETRVLNDEERLAAIYKTANRIAGTIKWQARGRGEGWEQQFEPRKDNLTNTITSVQKDNYVVEDFYKSRKPREYHETAPTLRSERQGLKVINATSQGYDIAEEGDSVNLSFPNSATMRGRVGHGESQTITTDGNQGTVQQMRIRRLTPKECWRLMGFDDEDFEKAKQANSDTQLYKQAGNSIVVNVLEGIVKNLFTERSEYDK